MADWVKGLETTAAGSVVPTITSPIVKVFQGMMAWANANTQFENSAKAEFARVADGWVAARAQTSDATLVANEVFDPNVKRRIPLPHLCKEFGVPYVGTFELLRTLNARLDWTSHEDC